MERISGNTYVLRGATNVGLYIDSDVVYMVDSGTSKRLLRDLLEDLDGKRVVLLNTHHHADHIALNSWLQSRTGCVVYAPLGEISMIANPVLEGYVLFGAEPPKSLKKDFFRAKPSKVEVLKDDLPLKRVPLPGHTPDHTGYSTPDGVLFSGDLYFSRDILQKYFYPYHASISILKETLRSFEISDYDFVVPSHGDPTSDPSRDVDFMMERIETVESEVLEILRESMTMEDLTLELSRKLNLSLEGGFWYLFRSFVGSVLQDLEREGLVVEEGIEWRRS